jgi:hypothetical protein
MNWPLHAMWRGAVWGTYYPETQTETTWSSWGSGFIKDTATATNSAPPKTRDTWFLSFQMPLGQLLPNFPVVIQSPHKWRIEWDNQIYFYLWTWASV